MTQRGAPAALRGYRLQALYTLKRIFAPGVDSAQDFCPEGMEDLDIRDVNEQVVEVLQVKSYANLTLSDLEPEKPNSFFHRAEDLLSGTNPPSIKIVNFGEIGPQMVNAWNGKEPQRGTIAKKLKEKGFQEPAIEKFFEQIELVSLDEESEHQKVFDQLQDYPTGIDTQHAFDLFVAWYYRRAEKRQSVTSAELRDQINRVGKFLAERYQHHQHWYTTIAPLESIPISDEKRVILRDEFYAGVHTRFEHILAELDFLREHKTNEITQEFQKSNVVIIHAASGQGKSTLAYRYVHEWYPDKWRFAIKRVQDVTQALGIARALSGFAEAIQVPIAVYLDVYPRDTEWPELVRQLAQHPYLEVLVTIREEDYRRASIADAGFEYGEVELEFNQQEAQLIYERARSDAEQWDFLDFDAAWDAFGGDGPLMEFVYLLTQTQTLPERLQGQVARIEKEVRMGSSPDELRLLQLVSVASTYGARLCTRELLRTLNLPAANRTLTQFEKEYLLRRSEDGFYLEGLHPVRSRILSSLLIQPDITPWLEIAAQAMPLMPEEDLETFILHAFVEQPKEYKNILEQVMMLTPHSWPGIAGVLRCLLWAGVKDYITENDTIIEEAYEVLGPAWWFTLDLNFSLEDEGPKLGEWWTNLGDLISQEKQDHIRAIRQSQSPKENVFRYATQWLETLDQRPPDTISPYAWRDVAEVWYWGTRLVPQRALIDWVSDEDLDKASEVLPLTNLADLSLSLHLSYSERHSRWLDKHIATLHRRLAHEHNILALEEIGTTLKIHFIFIPSGEAPADARDSLHEETMLKVRLIRKLIPTYEQYASQGYGFKLAGIELPQGDSTHKKGIPLTHLPPPWLVWLNGIAGGLARNHYRPATWDEYLDTIIEIRRLIVNCLKQLNRGLIKFCQRDRPLNVAKYIDLNKWQQCQVVLSNMPHLPASALDPWGFTNENAALSDSTKREYSFEKPRQKLKYTPRAASLRKYRSYLAPQREYIASLRNFVLQARDVWITNATKAGKLPPNDQRRAMVLRKLEELGVKTNPYLPVFNLFDAKSRLSAYQREFVTLFGESLDKVRIDALMTNEREVLIDTWTRWYFYAYEPWKSAANPKRQVLHWMSSAKRELRDQIDQALTSIQIPEFNAIRLDFAEYWQGEPAIWLRFNFTDPTELYKKMLEEFPRALREVWGAVGLRDPMRFLIQDICAYIVIIPVVQGKMLDEWVRPLYTSTVLQTEDLTERPWSHFPISLPEPIQETLSIPIWDAPEIMTANQLSESVAILQQLTSQVSEFQAMPDLTEPGRERLQTYIEKEISPLLSDALQTFFDTASELLKRFNALSEAEQEKREKLTNAIQALIEVHGQVKPAEGDGVFKLNIDELAAYSQRLQQVYTTIEGIRLFWIADILEQNAL